MILQTAIIVPSRLIYLSIYLLICIYLVETLYEQKKKRSVINWLHCSLYITRLDRSKFRYTVVTLWYQFYPAVYDNEWQ